MQKYAKTSSLGVGFFASLLLFSILTFGLIKPRKVLGNAPVSVPGSISNNCSQNVSSELNSWMASVSNGNELIFAPGGCYRIDQTLTLTNRSNLMINGNGATFQTNDPTGDGTPLESPSSAARTRSHWRLDGGNNITLKDMTIIGANPNAGVGDAAYVPTLEAQMGVDIRGSQNALVSNVDIYDVYGDFIYFGRGISNDLVPSGRVTGGHMERNGRQGISVVHGNSIIIDNNYLGQTRRSTFDLEPNGAGWSVNNVTIDNNDIGPGRTLFVAAHGVGPVNNVTITNNRLNGRELGSSISADSSGRRHDWKFNNNSSLSQHGTGTGNGATITFYNVDNIEMKNNIQPMQTGRNMHFVNLYNSTGLVFRGNTLENASGSARLLTDSTAIQICGNRYTTDGEFDLPEVCPADELPPVVSDTDSDGIDDTIEAAAPNGGDGNGDGVADKDQANVASLPSSTVGTYLTLVTPSGSTLTAITAVSTASLPKQDSYSYPFGLISFTLSGVGNGASASIELLAHTTQAASSLTGRKYISSTAQYLALPSPTLTTKTIGGAQAVSLGYSVTDGGSYDDDGVANGSIVDPVGLAILPGAPNTGAKFHNPLLASLALLAGTVVTTGLLANWLRRRVYTLSGE